MRRLVMLTLALVAVALVKPWGTDPRPADRPHAPVPVAVPAPAPAAAGIQEPTPEPAVGADEILCPGGGWDLVSLERLASWTVRTWVPIRPIVADGPDDPSIPQVHLGTDVLGVGICSAAHFMFGAGGRTVAGSPSIAAAWRLNPDAAGTLPSATPVSLDQPPVPAGGVSHPDLAVLYRAASSPSRWPEGRYILQLDTPTDAGGARWIGISIGSAQSP